MLLLHVNYSIIKWYVHHSFPLHPSSHAFLLFFASVLSNGFGFIVVTNRYSMAYEREIISILLDGRSLRCFKYVARFVVSNPLVLGPSPLTPRPLALRLMRALIVSCSTLACAGNDTRELEFSIN